MTGETTPSPTVTSADGTPIAYTAKGSGAPLVIVSGALAFRATDGTDAAVAQALADRYTTYTFDRRGRGESGDAETYSVQREIDDIAALIANADGEAVVLGYSGGAVLALEAALAGLPISGLALWEAPLIVSDARPPANWEPVLRALADGRRGDAVALHLVETGMPEELVAPMRSEPFWAGMEQLAPTLAYDIAIVGPVETGDPTVLDRYAAITVPTLVMHGGASPTWLADAATALAGVLPNATHRELPGQDHDVSGEALTPVLSDWLSAQR
jgi:pimeloyl-ACP methyl ester carboxylesterase